MITKTLILAIILGLLVIGCAEDASKDESIRQAGQDAVLPMGGTITMATTTSTYDSGLLDYLNPMFTAGTGIAVKIVSMGTGAAIRAGENGDADLILVHDTVGELAFVEGGYGIDRREVFHNDFIILGPLDNPAGIATHESTSGALAKIAASESTFISRGDDSGTHRKEQELWKATGLALEETSQVITKKNMDVVVNYVKPVGEWYLSIGQGMGAVLTMAYEKQAYVLTDRGTYLSYMGNIDLAILNEGDTSLVNQYGIIAVNPEKHEAIKYDLAMMYINWICSSEGQEAIGDFRKEGEVLFHPDYKPE